MKRPPSASLRQRLRMWALRRQGIDRPPFTLRSRRIYILPTRAGWTFAGLIGVMFIAGMNYGNGLALLFTFWLAGFALVAMVQTQRTLARTQVSGIACTPAFAGDAVQVRLQLQAARAQIGDLHLGVDMPGGTESTSSDQGSEGTVLLSIPVQQRGRWQLPPLRLHSTAPFGLFQTWTWLAIEDGTTVYPRPSGTLPVPETAGDSTGTSQRHQGQDELAWLRDFRDGDSPRQVAWKAYARGAPLLVREYRGLSAQRLEFDFAALTNPDVEARLSQLARWILDAETRGESWVLRMPGFAPLTGAGSDHRTRCLTLLALHGLPEEAAT